MTFTKDQMEVLAKYEPYFHTATKANYTRNPGRAGLTEMHRIFKSATGSAISLNTGCGHCIYSLVKAVAVAYYKDKEELERELKDYRPNKVTTNTTIKGKEVELQESIIEDRYQKVSIKTEKKNGKVKKKKSITEKYEGKTITADISKK